MAETGTQRELRFFYTTDQYEATVAFYRDGLDFTIVRSWDRGPTDRGALFRTPNGPAIIEVVAGAGGPPSQAGIYMEVDDVDAWYEKANQRNLSVLRELATTSYGHRSFRLVDPSGFQVGIFSYAR